MGDFPDCKSLQLVYGCSTTSKKNERQSMRRIFKFIQINSVVFVSLFCVKIRENAINSSAQLLRVCFWVIAKVFDLKWNLEKLSWNLEKLIAGAFFFKSETRKSIISIGPGADLKFCRPFFRSAKWTFSALLNH